MGLRRTSEVAGYEVTQRVVGLYQNLRRIYIMVLDAAEKVATGGEASLSPFRH